MMNFWVFVILAWCVPPIFYFATSFYGTLVNHLKRRKLQRRRPVELLIFQIPTIGNFRLVNNIFDTVRSYNLPVKLECWVVIEEDDKHKTEYNADRVIVVPKNFECEDLYKSRALEYARRLRVKMVRSGELTDKYLVIQADDDAVPSKEFIMECLKVDADIIIGSMSPRPKKFWTTVLDYERPVACGMICNFFTNINKPIWGHGEGTCISSKVDLSVSYDISDASKEYVRGVKLVSSEDLFYLHKVSNRGFVTFNSEKPIYILPPLNFKDAIKQRRRWIWGHINIVRNKMLPRKNRIRLAIGEGLGLLVYVSATFPVPLHLLGMIHIPEAFLPLTSATLALWLFTRFFTIGRLMGWKHGFIGMLLSYVTVTLNFFVHLLGIIQGDPKRFEVIRKE